MASKITIFIIAVLLIVSVTAICTNFILVETTGKGIINHVFKEKIESDKDKPTKLKEDKLEDCYYSDGKKFCKLGTIEVSPGEVEESDYEIKYKT